MTGIPYRSLGDNLSFRERFVRIPRRLRSRFLVVRWRPVSGFGMCGGTAQRRQYFIRSAILFQFLQHIFAGLLRDAIPLNLADHFPRGHLIVEHVADIVHAERALLLRAACRRFGIADQMRQLLIFHPDGADCIFRDAFVNRSDGNDLISSPVNVANRVPARRAPL